MNRELRGFTGYADKTICIFRERVDIKYCADSLALSSVAGLEAVSAAICAEKRNVSKGGISTHLGTEHLIDVRIGFSPRLIF